MDQKLTFERGMMPEINPEKKVPGSYEDALNMFRNLGGDLVEEYGLKTVHSLPAGYKVVGAVRTGDATVLASTDGTTSDLGIIGYDDVYTTIVSNTDMGFSKENRVWMVAKDNYKGETTIYIAGKGIKLRAVNIDDLPIPEDFDKITGLFLEYSLPVSKLSEVTSGGSVLTGAYQFGVRLVTGSGNTTAFGPVTGVIPIGEGLTTGSRKDYDGADPQTTSSNAIVVSVQNIDPTFEYIEPCVITYVGNSSTLTVKSLGQIAIDGRTEIGITYAGATSEGDDIPSEEVNLNSTLYTSANYIEDKDSSLLLAGVTEDSGALDYDWQSVANSLIIRHVEHKVSHYEETRMRGNDDKYWDELSDYDKKYTAGGNGYTTWTDEGSNGDFNDYKNPNTCAKFMSFRRGEVYSFSFTPIFKGGRRGQAYHAPALLAAEIAALADPTNVLEGVETEDYIYPSSFGDLAGHKVRYHRMPRNDVSPFVEENGSKENIVILGIQSEITAPAGWEDLLDGYIIGRESRTGFETIKDQGVTKYMFQLGWTHDDDGQGHSGRTSVCPIPGIGRQYITDVDRASFANEGWIPTKKTFLFNSPDGVVNKDFSYVPSKIRRVMSMKTQIKYMNTLEANRSEAPGKGLFKCFAGTPRNDERALISGFSNIQTESQSITDDHLAGPEGVNLTNTIFGDTTMEYRRIMATVALRIDPSDDDLPSDFGWVDRFEDIPTRGDSLYRIHNDQDPNDEFDIDLYNIEVDSRNYYGDIYSKTFLPINTVLFKVGSKDPRTDADLDNATAVSFGGDTFISRFAYTFRDTIPFFGSIGGRQNISKTDHTLYFMVESSNNYNLRHYRDGETDVQDSVPYYPKLKVLQGTSGTGINNQVSALGHPELYNRQYSAQNSLQTTYSNDVDTEIVTEFSNRIPYSATSIEGDKFDAYRLFLPNNYHDIPRKFGKITGLFTQGDLYVHTERALWRAFYNTMVTQATSVGEIVLGNGGAFNRPSVPLMTMEGGYGGCKDLSASIQTTNGRFWFDSDQAKMFQLTEGMDEVSYPSVYSMLRQYGHLKDVRLAWDANWRRVILTMDGLTMSYSPIFKSFNSRHSYDYSLGFNMGVGDYLTKDNIVGKFDKALVANYFDVQYPTSLKIVSSLGVENQVTFTSMEFLTTCMEALTELNKPFTFIDSYRCSNRDRNSDTIPIEVDLDGYGWDKYNKAWAHRVANRFRIATPKDAVIDINQDIFNPENLVTFPGQPEESQLWQPDITGNFLSLETNKNTNMTDRLTILAIIINFEQNNI